MAIEIPYNSAYEGSEIDAGVGATAGIGNLASLTTTEKTTLVGAANELNTEKANISALKDGTLEVAVAVLAKALKVVSDQSGATQTEPFFCQATATANNTASTPTAPTFRLNGLRGNTIVYNQLVNTGTTSVATISGHKYWTNISGEIAIVTADGAAISVADTDKVVDLTRWFNGSIPSAITDDPTVFPINYYDDELTYSAGELKNCSCTELTTIGLNQWDEEWESGEYNITTGAPTANANAIRSKNYTKVVPNSVYYGLCNLANYILKILFYDVNKNFISATTLTTLENRLFTTPSNCRYLMLSVGGSVIPVTSYSGGICINLSWDGERDGTYEPYISHTYPMVWSGKSAGTAYDEKLPDGTEITRIGSYTFTGSETWVIQTTYAYTGNLSMDNGISNSVANIDILACDGIRVVNGNPKRFSMWLDTSVYDTQAKIQALTAGKTVYYALETPTTSSGDAYTSVIEGDDYGTMGFDSIVPVGNEFFYPADYALLVDDLYNLTNGDVGALMLKSENVVPTAPAEDGTYTLKLTKSGDTKTYSWVGDS